MQLVDVLVWVVDPQKYADAALHDRYLKPLASHAEVMMVVLNQADRLGDADRERCLADLRRLLASEGLPGVPVLAASAESGYGVEELRARLIGQVADKKAAARRLAADVGRAAERLSESSGSRHGGGSVAVWHRALNVALAEAAGVPAVVDAVGQAWRRRGGLATGWPVLSWLVKLRPDPLRRLHLDRGAGAAEGDRSDSGRSQLPAADHRGAAGSGRDGSAFAGRRRRPPVEPRLVRRHEGRCPLTRGLLAGRAGSSDGRDRSGSGRHRGWWQVIRILQWLLVAAVSPDSVGSGSPSVGVPAAPPAARGHLVGSSRAPC